MQNCLETDPDQEGRERSLTVALAELSEIQQGHRTTEAHGPSLLMRRNSVPVEANGCLLPDGSLTEAECLTRDAALDDAARIWIRKLPKHSGVTLRRRGRLRIEAGTAIDFIDAPEADLPGVPASRPPSLAYDMGASPRLRSLGGGSDVFARLLYAALCNLNWKHRVTGQLWHSSWRDAGRVVAGLRCSGTYADWYCGGGEGTVDEQVLAELDVLGWEPVETSLPEG